MMTGTLISEVSLSTIAADESVSITQSPSAEENASACVIYHNNTNATEEGLYSIWSRTNGGYPYPSLYTWRHIIMAAVVVGAIMLIIVAGNILVIIAIAVDRSLKGLQNWFIASLAVSDLFVGSVIMPLSLANELMGYWAFGDVLCQLWLSTDVLLCTASILNLVLISLDRYWSITRAVVYVKARTRQRTAVMIATVWLVSMVICLPPLFGWKSPQPMKFGYPLCVLSEEPGYVLYSTIGSFYVPLTIMILVYFKIYLAAKHHARKNLKKYENTSNGKFMRKDGSTNLTTATICSNQFLSDRFDLKRGSQESHAKELSSDLELSDCFPHQSSPKKSSKCVEDGQQKNTSHLLQTTPTNQDHKTFEHGPFAACQHQKLSQRKAFGLFPDDVDTPKSEWFTSGKPANYQERRTESLPEGRLVSGRSKSFEVPYSEPIIDVTHDKLTGTSQSISPSTTISQCSWQLLSNSAGKLRCEAMDRRSQRSDSDSIQPCIGNERSRHKSLATVFYFNINVRERLEKISFPTRRTRRIEDPTDNNIVAQERFRRKIARAKERRATLVLGIVMASFIGCWLPFFSIYPITLLAGLHIPDAVFAVIFWLGYVNSALNPIIYTIFNSDFRQAFSRLLCRRRTPQM